MRYAKNGRSVGGGGAVLQRVCCGVLIVALLTIAGAAQDGAAIEKQLVGTWRLISYNQRLADGTTRPSPAAGPNGAGYLIYTEARRMCAVIMNPDRAPAAGQSAAAADASLVTISYCGRYEVDVAEGSVLHHVEVDRSRNSIGTPRKRFFTLSGNRLHLRMPPAAGVTEATLIWERIDR
jgi:hypothetical protein